MIQVEELDIGGSKVQGVMAVAPGGEGHPNMILIQCRKGYLMCGYLNLAVAEKFGDAAVLGGGADFEALLAGPVKGVTEKAREAGVKEGMTCLEAARVLDGVSG